MVLKVTDLTDEHGIYLVKIARQAIEKFVIDKTKIKPPKDVPNILWEKAGVFVTINKLIKEHEELRGCIGYIMPIKPLIEATIDVAIAAATEDPRFPPVSSQELDTILVEVTVLTPPQKVEVKSPDEYLDKIKIGRDGLLLKYGMFSGTLLPQVPVEYGWDVETFLDHLCLKAGLPLRCWKNPDVEIFSYQGIMWKEISPRGKISRVKL